MLKFSRIPFQPVFTGSFSGRGGGGMTRAPPFGYVPAVMASADRNGLILTKPNQAPKRSS